MKQYEKGARSRDAGRKASTDHHHREHEATRTPPGTVQFRRLTRTQSSRATFTPRGPWDPLHRAIFFSITVPNLASDPRPAMTRSACRLHCIELYHKCIKCIGFPSDLRYRYHDDCISSTASIDPLTSSGDAIRHDVHPASCSEPPAMSWAAVRSTVDQKKEYNCFAGETLIILPLNIRGGPGAF